MTGRRLALGAALLAAAPAQAQEDLPAARAPAASGGPVTLSPITVEGQGQDARTSPPGFVAGRSAVGTKTDAPILEIPQSVSVVTRDQLNVRNVQSDPQALLYTPGLWAQPFGGDQNQNNPFFVIRGFETAFGGSYLDGLVSPVNYRYEPFGLDRIDVLRGPSSTLYGQAELGGIVNRISRRPPRTFSGEVQAQTGTYDRRQAAADIGGPVDAQGRVLYRLTGLVRDADAPIDYDEGHDPPDERTFVAPALAFNGRDTALTLLASYLDDKIGQESSFRAQDGELTRTSLTQPGYNDFKYNHHQLGYELRHRFPDSLELRHNLRYADMENERTGFYQGDFDPTTNTVQRFLDGFEEDRNDLTVDTHLQAGVATGPIAHTLLFGLDHQNLRDRSTFTTGDAPPLDLDDPDYDEPIGTPVPFIRSRFRTDIMGVYLQDQLSLDDRWILTLGGRYDWANGEVDDELAGGPTQKPDDEELTWRAGLSYVSELGVAPYVSYATSFLPSGGTDTEGDPLAPTTGHQYEAGVKYQPPGWNARFTAAVYELTKEDVVTADPDDPFGQVQVGKIRSRGVELEATASLAQGVDVSLAYAYNDAEVTKDTTDIEGNDPVRAPKNLASAWLSYTFQGTPLERPLVGAGGRYVDNTFADPENTLKNDDYFLVDAAAGYELGNIHGSMDGAAVGVNATNLLDEDYSICFTNFDCNWGAGRTVIATLSYRW